MKSSLFSSVSGMTYSSDQTTRTPSPALQIVHEFWRETKDFVLLSTVISILAAISSVMATYAFSRLIDMLTEPFIPTTVIFISITYVIMIGLSSGLQYSLSYTSNILSEHFTFKLSTRYVQRLLHKPASLFIDLNPGELLHALSKAQEASGSLIQLVMLVLIPAVTRIFLTIGLMYAVISFDMAVIVGLYGVALLLITYFSNRQSRKHLDGAISTAQTNARFLGNALSSVETLRITGSADWIFDTFRRRAWNVYGRWRSYGFYRLRYTALIALTLCAQFGATFLILIPRFTAGHISIGDIVLFNALLLQLNQPFEVLGQAVDDGIRARSALHPLNQILNSPDILDVMPVGSDEITGLSGIIRFESVTYRHSNGRGINEVSFQTVPGHITFLIGESGAGKSTILRLLLKSLAPQAGRILVSERDLQSVSDEKWHSNVGLVPQDILLLNDTIEANIVLGRPYDAKRLGTAVRLAELDHIISETPDGLRATVGERGLKLSGGERQRVAIARALYTSPSVLLLDEASSALDVATEKEIMSHLRRLSSEITIIAVTHRISVIAATDTAYVLRDGRLEAVETK